MNFLRLKKRLRPSFLTPEKGPRDYPNSAAGVPAKSVSTDSESSGPTASIAAMRAARRLTGCVDSCNTPGCGGLRRDPGAVNRRNAML